VNSKIHFDFVKHRNKFFAFSILVTIVGIITLLAAGMHFGVDFKAGTTIDASLGQSTEKQQVEKLVSDEGFEGYVVTMGANNERTSVRFDEILGDADIKKIETALTAKYGDKVSTEVNTVSADMATEMGVKAIYAVLIAAAAICIYVTIRFEWRFAIAAIIAILYDAFFVVAMFAIFRFEVDLPFLAAVLTTIGYSINDKIVIFDRVRENMRFAKLRTDNDLADLINHSIWQTMARNVYTVLTVLIAAVCLMIFGSESIKLFALAKVFGLTSGAYSSVCIATALWFLLRRNKLGATKKVAAAK